MRRHQDDLSSDHQAGASGRSQPVDGPRLQLRSSLQPEADSQEDDILQSPPSQDGVWSQTGAKLGWRGCNTI